MPEPPTEARSRPETPSGPGPLARRPALRRAAGVLALLAGLVLVTWGAGQLWRYGRASVGFDFYQFWVVAQAVDEGVATDVYDDAERSAMAREFAARAEGMPPRSRWARVAEQRPFIKTWSTPFLYTAFRPLASGAYGRDLRAYQRLSLACGLLGTLAFAHLAGLGWVPALLVVAWVLARWFPAQADMLVANVNQLQLAWLAAIVWLVGARAKGSVAAGGALLGALVAFKPNLAATVALLGALEVARARWGRLRAGAAGFALGAAGAVGASGVFFGSLRPWGDWLAFLRTALYDQRAMTVVEHGNLSLDRLAYERWGVHPGGLVALALVLALGAHLRGEWRARHERDDAPGALRRDALWAVAVGLALGLVSAPLTFGHYYVLALPAVLLVIADPRGPARPVRRALGVLTLLLFGAPASFWSGLGILADDPTGSVLLYGLAVLGVLLALLAHRRPGPVTAG